MNHALVARTVLLLSLVLPFVTPRSTQAEPFARGEFRALWWRTDQLVQEGAVARTWLWGPEAGQTTSELYADSPNGERLVQYFDKSRMEINNPNAPHDAWYVTNGLLVREMATGRMQLGDNQFVAKGALLLSVAGDPDRNPRMPTYADFSCSDPALATGARQPLSLGQAVTAFWNPEVQAAPTSDPDLARRYPETTYAYYDQVTGLNVPGIFWSYFQQAGDVLDGNRRVRTTPLFSWLYVLGRPISGAYWTRGLVGGQPTDVLVQLFERRVLTYTPSNAVGWQVEMGNVGQHYRLWRYQNAPVRPPVLDLGNSALVYRHGTSLLRYELASGQKQPLLTLPKDAQNLVLSSSGLLAFSAGDTLYLADPRSGSVRAVYQPQGRSEAAWQLIWSTDGQVLAYAQAYDTKQGSRLIELGTYDGVTQQVVTTIEGRTGPAPNVGPAPGFTQLQILGYNRQAGRIWAVPTGGIGRYQAVWLFATTTGERSTLITLDTPATIQEVAASPDVMWLAMSRTPNRLNVINLVVPQAPPLTYRLSTAAPPIQLRWEPSNSRIIAYATYEQFDSAVPATPFYHLWTYDLVANQPNSIWVDTTHDGYLFGWHPGGQALTFRWLESKQERPHYGLVSLHGNQLIELDLDADSEIVGWLRPAGM